MFAYIQGKLVEKNPAYAVIEANGVGYMLHISLNTYILLEDTGICKLYTHHVVREDAQLLFGFANEEERDLFRLLISVSGIGPNTARMVLSSLKVSDLKDAITGGKVGVLKSIKGIGEKSAQRIIVDLKDKVEKSDASIPEKVEESHNTVRQEALSGLITLGFQRKSAEKAMDHVISSEMQARKTGGSEHEITVEYLIRESLKIL
jgi:holliday junction DNA helicase RuvA